jgi:histidinol dehydrogenase
MKICDNPGRNEWGNLLSRPMRQSDILEDSVREILTAVRKDGDIAVEKYSIQFDQINLSQKKVSAQEFENAVNDLDDRLKDAILYAKQNITAFHQNQIKQEAEVEIAPGITCWRKSVGIEKIGLYIPGGTAPLFSTLLMLGIPAALAGCKEIILCSPPQKNGLLHPAILYTAKILGIQNIYKIGGVQAIAAMAYGTETITSVYKIFGPGNQYVTKAKQLVQLDGIAIDMPAGPSELAIIADKSANPEFLAADLLSQCEHGADSQVILVTNNRSLADQVNLELLKQQENLPRKSVAAESLRNSKIFLMEDAEESIALINEYAPEHLILACENADLVAEKIRNAGSVFIGNYAPESAGDYASGTNHTLPTNGFARAYSGVSVESFVKKISFQRLTKSGLELISKTVTEMARAEGLEAHAAAVEIRFRQTT